MKPEIEHKTFKSQESRNKVVFIPAKLRMGDKKETPREHDKHDRDALFFLLLQKVCKGQCSYCNNVRENKKNSAPPSPTKFLFYSHWPAVEQFFRRKQSFRGSCRSRAAFSPWGFGQHQVAGTESSVLPAYLWQIFPPRPGAVLESGQLTLF